MVMLRWAFLYPGQALTYKTDNLFLVYNLSKGKKDAEMSVKQNKTFFFYHYQLVAFTAA